VGEEVIVDFLDGNPDRPIITGRVYNADCTVPYELPDQRTRSTIKTRSTPGGGEDNFNELRFEDKMGEEEIYLHAERDFLRVVENDDVLKVGFDKKDPGNQSVEIYNNQTIAVGASGCGDGSQQLTVWKDRVATVKTGDDRLTLEQGSRAVTIARDDHITVQGGDSVVRRVEADQVLAFFGLSPKLGPIADWGLDLHKKQINVDTEKFQTNVPGIFAVGDVNAYPGKKKLILSGFHEGALAAFAIKEYLEPGKKVHLQYTTTSPLMHKRLGVPDDPAPGERKVAVSR